MNKALLAAVQNGYIDAARYLVKEKGPQQTSEDHDLCISAETTRNVSIRNLLAKFDTPNSLGLEPSVTLDNAEARQELHAIRWRRVLHKVRLRVRTNPAHRGYD